MNSVEWIVEKAKGFNLFNYQEEIIRKALTRDTYALFVEMGLGKTLMALSIMVMRKVINGISKVLVVCPKTVADSWLKEIEKIKNFAGLFFTIDAKNLTNLNAKEAERVVNDLNRFKYDLQIDIVNFEKLYNIENFPQYDMLIIDESTRIKNPNAQRTRVIFDRFLQIPYRIILTGSPIVREVSDLWSQLYVVNGVKVDYATFKKKVKKDKTRWIEYANSNIVTLTKDDIERMGLMKFPEKVYKTFSFELSDEAKLHYHRINALMQKSILLEDKKKVLATIIQMQRVTSGFNPFSLQEFKENRKKKLLGKLISSGMFSFPVIIWAAFVRDIEVIYQYLISLGYKGAMLYGQTNMKLRRKIIDDFQSGKYHFLVAHPIVLGIGVTLVASNVCFYYSNSFRFEDRIQSEDRIHRVNQPKDKCYYIDLVARGTIDELVLSNLKSKKSLSDVSIEEMKKIFLKGKE